MTGSRSSPGAAREIDAIAQGSRLAPLGLGQLLSKPASVISTGGAVLPVVP